MKSNYVIIKEKGVVLETLSGIVTLEECVKHREEVVRDENFSPEFKIISDMSQAVFEMPKADVSALLQMDKSKDIETVALVHKGSVNVYQRMLNLFSDFFPIQHFYSVKMDDLLKHLNLNDIKAEIENGFSLLKKVPKFNWA